MKASNLIAYMLTATTLFVSCAEVDLCDSNEHPHCAFVKFNYDMSGLKTEEAEHIDSMSIIAYRIVGQWKSLIKTMPNGTGNFIDVNRELQTLSGKETATRGEGTESSTTLPEQPSSDTGTPPADEKIPGQEEERPADSVEPGQPMAENSDQFKVKPGDYKFITLTMDTTEIDYTEIYEYIKAPAEEKLLSDVCVSYRTFGQNDPHMKEQLRNWDDYNQYASYVQPSQRPIVFDMVPLVPVEQGQTTTVNLKPTTKMQNVTVIFDILKKTEKVPFVVDSVWMELSGIPIRLNLTSHHLDITRTAKTMAKMTLTNEDGGKEDEAYNTHLNCMAQFEVNGVVAPTDSEDGTEDASKRTSGPGLLQVIIFTHSNEVSTITGKPKHKRFQGLINLYNTLRQSPSIKLTQDGMFAEQNGDKCLIRITDSILLDGENIKSYSNEDGGVKNWDKWTPTSKDDLIIEV